MALFEAIAESRGIRPIVILDDVFAQLDESRRHQILDFANDQDQVLVTAAAASDIPQDDRANIIDVASLKEQSDMFGAMPMPSGSGSLKPPITVTLKLDQRTLPAQVFERYARREDSRKIRAIRAELRMGELRQNRARPGKLGGVATVIAKNGNWMPYLKISQLNNHWDQVVGPGVAQHSMS